MVALEVSVNGEVVCTAGVGARGILSAEVKWLCVDRKIGDTVEELCVWPHGVDTTNGTGKHWPKAYVKLGDEITIRIVERNEVDPFEEHALPPPAH